MDKFQKILDFVAVIMFLIAFPLVVLALSGWNIVVQL